jgi:CheY-like chemotaxis protein
MAGGAPRILIVDDFDDSREMMAEFLRISGFSVLEASDGKEAVDRATSELPDVVVMDLTLPVMDGWEATRRLKANARTSHIPVVALTGHSSTHGDEALAAGCVALLTKPCMPDVLEAKLRELLASRPSEP